MVRAPDQPVLGVSGAQQRDPHERRRCEIERLPMIGGEKLAQELVLLSGALRRASPPRATASRRGRARPGAAVAAPTCANAVRRIGCLRHHLPPRRRAAGRRRAGLRAGTPTARSPATPRRRPSRRRAAASASADRRRSASGIVRSADRAPPDRDWRARSRTASGWPSAASRSDRRARAAPPRTRPATVEIVAASWKCLL